MKKSIKFYGSIDRIEGDIAILLVGDEGSSIEISKYLLPEGCKEGDIISFKLERKDKKTKTEKERVANLIKKLSS